jgi:3-ketosteroid 9alpha-monooxygenase subunit A
MTDLADPRTQRPAAPTPDTSAAERRYPFGIPFGWFMVAWSDELPRGAVLPRYLLGKHLVVWRDDDGVAHAQDAFCPHLGAHLGHGGVVKGTELECPFHGWRFDGEGRNTCIPYSQRTNAKARVHTYEVVELADHFVMAWFHPYGDPPKFSLELPPEATSDEFTEWTTVERTVAAGQQELAENTVDGPHFRYVHNTETVPEIESYTTDGWVARTKSVQRFPTPRGVVDGRIDIENQGPGFGFTWFRGIVDTLLVGCSTPVDDQHTRVRFNFKVRRLADAKATSNVGRAFIDEVCKQFEEDRPVWENKAHLARPALADTDPPYLQFRKWYAQFYADGLDEQRTVWEPPPPPDAEQPVFVRSEETASRKHRR